MIKEPIEIRPTEACLDLRNRPYFFRVFYNALCRKQNFTDILLELNMSDTDLMKDFFNTDGGISNIVVSDMLKFLTQSEIINIYPPVSDPPFDWNPDSPFLIIKNLDFPNYLQDGIPVEFTFHDVDFEIEFAVLAFESKTIGIHDVVGYKCNEVCKIYDSNNRFYDFNWQNPTSEELSNFLDLLGKVYETYFTEWHFTFILYIRKDVKLSLNKLKIPELCKLQA